MLLAHGGNRSKTELGYMMPLAVEGWEPGGAMQFLEYQKYSF